MTDDEELVRLRTEVATLRSALEAQTPSSTTGTTAAESNRTRLIFAGILIAMGAVLAPISVVAIWAHDVVGDTDRYVETVTPLSSNPAVKTAITDRVAEVIIESLSVDELAASALGAVAQQDFVPPKATPLIPGLEVPVASAIDNFVHGTVEEVVDSEGFEQAWVAANREAHEQAVALLMNENSEDIDVPDGQVSINIAGFVDAAKNLLIDRGFEMAERIPEINASFAVFHSASLYKAQTAFSLLDTGARVLPLLALAFLCGGILVAPSRRVAILGTGIAVAAMMVALGILLNIVRPFYLQAVPDDVLPNAAAAVVFDQFTQFLTTSLRAVAVIALVITVAAFLRAERGAGKMIRTGAGRAIVRARERFSLFRGPASRFITRYRKLARTAVIAACAMVYILLPHPSGASALAIAIAMVICLTIIELFVAGPSSSGQSTRSDRFRGGEHIKGGAR